MNTYNNISQRNWKNLFYFQKYQLLRSRNFSPIRVQIWNEFNPSSFRRVKRWESLFLVLLHFRKLLISLLMILVSFLRLFYKFLRKNKNSLSCERLHYSHGVMLHSRFCISRLPYYGIVCRVIFYCLPILWWNVHVLIPVTLEYLINLVFQ